MGPKNYYHFFIIIIIALVSIPVNNQSSSVRENSNNFQVEGWSEDIGLSDLTNDYSCQFPNIAASNHYVHILWDENLNSLGIAGHGLCYRRSIDSGNNWDDIVYLSHPNSSFSNDIIVSGSNVHVIFTSDLQEGVFYRRSTDNGSTWGPIMTNLTEIGGTDLNIEVYKNNIHIVWAYDWNNVWGLLYLRSTDNGNTWEPAQWLINGTGKWYHPINARLAVVKNTIFFIYWSINDTINLMKSIDNGNTWEHKILSKSPHATFPQIAAEKNNVGVVWVDDTDLSRLQLQFMKSEDYGKTWSKPRFINDQIDELFVSPETPSMVIVDGNYHLVWEDYRDCYQESTKTYTEIYYKIGFGGGIIWSEDIRLTKKEPLGPSSREPVISVNKNSIYTLFRDDRNEKRTQIYFKRSLPDFTLIEHEIPSKGWANVELSLNFTIKNIGYADGYKIPILIKDSNKIIYKDVITELKLNKKKELSIPWKPIDPGIHQIEIIIDNNNNLKEWNETNNICLINVTIQKNISPIAIIKIDQFDSRTFENITFDASESYDPDGSIHDYYFDFNDGNNSGWINESKISYSYSQPGQYRIELIIRDNHGAENQNIAEQEVIIKWWEIPPVINNVVYNPINPVGNENVTISVDAFDLNNDNLEYEYIPDNGTIFGSDENVTWHTPKLPGKYRIIISVFDGEFHSEEWFLDITVNKNHEPIIEEINISSTWISLGESINISINATDEDNHILFYDFNSEEGTIIKNNSNITWQSPLKDGIYLIEINISDNHSGFANEEIFIIVGNPTPDSLIKSFTITPIIIYKNENTEISIELEVDGKYINLLDTVNVNLTLFNRNRPQQLYDTGKNGDKIANDGIYSFQFNVKINNLTGEEQIWANIKTRIPDFELNTSTIINIENKVNNNQESLLYFYYGITIIFFIVFIIIIWSLNKRKKINRKE